MQPAATTQQVQSVLASSYTETEEVQEDQVCLYPSIVIDGDTKV